MKRIMESVLTAAILAIISGFIGLFIHVQSLDAKYSLVEQKFEYIQKELTHIRKRVDKFYESRK